MPKNKAKKMYDNPPKVERDEKGALGVKAPTKADAVQSGTDGVDVHAEHAMRDMHHRHEMEHMAMNRRHEVEHHSSGGDAGLPEKHVTEHKEMNTRHIGELKKAMSRSAKDGSADTKAPKEKLESPKEEKKAKSGDAGLKD